MISFPCTNCSAPLKADDARAGKTSKCPRCKSKVQVPSATPAPVSGPRETQRPEAPPPPELTEFLAPARGQGELGWLGSYRVRKILGSGGMGVVFLAEDSLLGRPVALKVILPAYAKHPNARERFLREARLAAGLKHENVVSIYQMGEERDVLFQAMEYLEGESLETKLRRGPLPLTELYRIGRDSARGLAAAHELGQVHRDVKPGNLWLERNPSGGEPRVKVLDFGLARDVRQESDLTQSGMIVGTPAYMAPEQARGLAVDSRSDLFGLGCVLYRAATGKFPFRGETTLALLASLATTEPDPPTTHRPELPDGFVTLLRAMMAKKPDERLATAREAADRLDRLLADLVTPPPTVVMPLPAPTAPPKKKKRRWVRWVAGGAGVLLLLSLMSRDENADKKKGESDKKSVEGDKKAPVSPPSVVDPLPGPGDSPLAWLKRDKLDADDVAWTFGKAKVPPEVVGVVRKRGPATTEAKLTGFSLSPDGRLLAQGGFGLQVDVADLVDAKHHPGTRSSDAIAFFFPKRTPILFTGSPSAYVTRRDLKTHEEKVHFGGPPGTIASAYAMPPDERYLLLGTTTGQLVMVPALVLEPKFPILKAFDRFTEIDRVSAHDKEIVALAFGGVDGRWVASADVDGKVRTWHGRPGKQLLRASEESLATNGARIRQIGFGPGATLFVCVAGSPALQRVHAEKHQAMLPWSMGMELDSFALSPDGAHLAALGPQGTIRVWNVGAETRHGPDLVLPSLPNGDVYGPIQYAPDGKHLLVGHSRGAVVVLRPRS